MKLIGYREANFRPDNGKGEEIKGYMIYLGNEIDPRRGGGMEAERQYLTQSKIDREGISLPEKKNKKKSIAKTKKSPNQWDFTPSGGLVLMGCQQAILW